MKKHISIILAIFIGLLVIANACKKDESTPDKNPFSGTYTGTMAGFNATVKISDGSANNRVVMNINFDGLGDAYGNLNATTSGDSVVIPNQNYDGNTISGEGTKSGNTLTFELSERSGMVSLGSTFVGTKK